MLTLQAGGFGFGEVFKSGTFVGMTENTSPPCVRVRHSRSDESSRSDTRRREPHGFAQEPPRLQRLRNCFGEADFRAQSDQEYAAGRRPPAGTAAGVASCRQNRAGWCRWRSFAGLRVDRTRPRPHIALLIVCRRRRSPLPRAP